MKNDREAPIEEYLADEIVDWHDGLCLKLKWLGGIGFPDRVILLPGGRVIFVELKRPGGRKGPLQPWWADTLKRLGFRHEWIWSHAGVDSFLDSL
jgi:hypothetical protein